MNGTCYVIQRKTDKKFFYQGTETWWDHPVETFATKADAVLVWKGLEGAGIVQLQYGVFEDWPGNDDVALMRDIHCVVDE